MTVQKSFHVYFIAFFVTNFRVVINTKNQFGKNVLEPLKLWVTSLDQPQMQVTPLVVD